MPLTPIAADLLDEATGRRHRDDPSSPTTGGPAGNARLTAWTGLLLLVLIAAELVTLLDVRGLISWHIVVGVLLVPVALLKTGSTGWRILRYYTGHRPYRSAGPPPTLLRLLGPAVVVTTLGLLGSGLALIALGAEASRRKLLGVLGQRIDAVTIHQVLFIAFAVVVGLHILARTVPALTIALGRVDGGRRRVPGIGGRTLLLVVTGVVAAITAVWLLGASGSWQTDSSQHRPPDGIHAAPR